MKEKYITIIRVLIVLTLIISGVLFWFYISKPNTYLNTVNISFKTKGQISNIIQEQAKQTFYLNIDDEIIEVESPEFGLEVDLNKTIKKSIRNSGEHSLVITQNNEVFNQKVNELNKQYSKEATEPEIIFDEETFQFKSLPGEKGRVINTEVLRDNIIKNYETNSSDPIKISFIQISPEKNEDEVKKNTDKANGVLNTDLTLTGLNSLPIDKTLIKSWIIVNDAEVDLDTVAINNWVQGNKDVFNRQVQNGSRRVTSDGRVVRVELDNVDGYELQTEETAKSIYTSLLNQENGEVSSVYNVTEAVWQDKEIASGAEEYIYPALPGEKWININLSNHSVTAYEGVTPVITTPMISAANEYPNAVGEYSIYWKLPKQTMKGKNFDGTTYETEDVPWILYYHGGYALHGAYWRSSFGYNAGSDGSHGCINLPVSNAKTLYDWAEEGTKVVSHY